MKTHDKKIQQLIGKQILFSALALLTAIGLAGCVSTGYHKGDSAAESFRTAAADVQVQNRSLDNTMGALKDLVSEPPSNLKVQYANYSDAVDRLVKANARVGDNSKKIGLKSAAYFKEWDAQIAKMQSDEVRGLSQYRRTEVTNRVETACNHLAEAQGEVNPLVMRFKDIRKALGTDLTTDGINSMRTAMPAAEQELAKAHSTLEALTSELIATGNHLSTSGMPAGAVTAP